MSEFFTKKLIENVIQANKHLVTRRNETFGVNHERVDQVFDKVNSFNDIKNLKKRIIKKAAHILGGITWNQPFNNANKSTAVLTTKYFLRKNGFDLPLKTEKDEDELIVLLIKTVYKFEGDLTIISEVEEYLLKKVVKLK